MYLVTTNATVITTSQLVSILEAIDGKQATFASFILGTVPNLKKTGNPYRNDSVEKISNVYCQLNTNYTNAVNNQREREQQAPSFQAATSWHERANDEFNGCITKNKNGNGVLYVNYIEQSSKRVGYTINGTLADNGQADIIGRFTPAYRPSNRQGTQQEVKFRVVKVSNIREAKIKGNEYIVLPD